MPVSCGIADPEASVRCSTWARQADLSPIGTAGSYRGFLLVETPLPWPRDVGQIPALASVAPRAGESGLRLQALVPSALGAAPETRRVILHAAADVADGFICYRRWETVASDSLEVAVDRLIEVASAGGGRPEPSAQTTDVLVCTHGRRDVCCGSAGTDLALRLAAAGVPPGVATWRTSHTGGHRFAPTVIVLPQGTAWAFMDVELVGRVLDRSVPFSEISHHYRGCAGLGSPQAQVLERQVLIDVGWELLDRARSAYPTGETTADGGTVIRLEAGVDRWEAVVRPGRTLPVPDCMKPLSEAKKTETEWQVSELRSAA